MRIDPSQLGEQLRQVTAAGAADAARGSRSVDTAKALEGESKFEALDRLLLKRLAVQSGEDAARSVVAFADAEALAARTAQLAAGSPDAARTAQGHPARDRVRGLLE